MAKLTTEWVNVTDGVTIIARESGEVWFHNANSKTENVDPFAAPMSGIGTEASTVGLLDGAINLGFSGIEQRLAPPEPTLIGYVVALIGAYHTSVDTPRNLRAAERFEQLGRPEIADYLEIRAREETGHDRLALKDLDALGVPGERLVANFIPEGIRPLCDRFDELCRQDYPIGSIGYSYCLERIAALKQSSDIAKVQTLCPAGVDATRFLRSHSALGSEVSHVKETIEFVAALPANDRTSVVQETYRSALLMAEGYNHELLRPTRSFLRSFAMRSEKNSRLAVLPIAAMEQGATPGRRPDRTGATAVVNGISVPPEVRRRSDSAVEMRTRGNRVVGPKLPPTSPTADVAGWLAKHGLDRYARTFAENNIELSVLPDLTEGDLEKLGVSLGHRKTMLRAIAALNAMPQPFGIVSAPAPAAGHREDERRQITAMFCDLVESTQLSEKLDPEDLRLLIDAYREVCSKAVRRYGGEVARWCRRRGDGLLRLAACL